MAMLKIEGLKAAYGEIEVLHGIDVEVDAGEIVAVIGANSSGKSTTLSCISHLMNPSAGTITFEGVDITRKNPEEIVDLGLIQCPEGRQLFSRLTVRENLELGAFCKRARGDKMQTLEKVFTFLPRLKERENQIAGSLSGGEAQMLAIGRSMMSKPKLLMLDEPSLGLAPIVVLDIMRLIKQMRDDEGVTVLLVEQNVKQSLKTANRAYVLDNGRVAVSGKSFDLLSSEEVRKAYLGI